jgi:ubiquinone/menaquinone biosynthesis C-methylase UbiE
MDQKAEVQRFFDRVVYYTPYEERYVKRTNLNAYDILKRKDVVLECFDRMGISGGRLLDIGCGPAVFAPDFVSRGFTYEGVDLAPDVVERAREIMSHHPHGDRARFGTGDIEALTFPDQAFDVVLVSGLFDYLPSDERALREIRRVLKPGGVAMISLQNRWSYCTLVRSIFWPLRPLLRALFGQRMRGRELTGSHWTKTHVPRRFRETAARVGFRPLLSDVVNFNVVPFNLPRDFPAAYFRLLNAVNDRPALRAAAPWLYATALEMLRRDQRG